MAKTGRPKLQFDLEQVEKLAMLQCTEAEIAAFFGCDPKTITNRLRDDDGFSTAYKNGRDKGKMSLRRWQFKAAENGNTAMLIWLGKQYLGQRDSKQEIEQTVSVKDSPREQLIDELSRIASRKDAQAPTEQVQ